MKRRILFLAAGLLSFGMFCGQAGAQVDIASLGEQSLVFSCFYECKAGPVVQGIPTWQEVTTLMLANQSNRQIGAALVFLNGNERIIAASGVTLTPEDLDEVNVCRTLFAGGVAPPPAGLVEVVLNDPTGVGGVYGWVKNLLGKFFVTVDEPFEGRVTGVAKTQCRLVPPSVTTPNEIFGKVAAQQPPPPLVNPVLVEATGPDPN